jgi:hypothetical protein
VLRDSATNLGAQKADMAEDRRIGWTTYENLSLWFDNWENELLDQGFAHRNPDNQICIPPDRLKNILNFDETCLSLDGSTNVCGGRPEAILYDPRFPVVGMRTCKLSLTTTMITGSSAAGDPIPPHLQFMSKSTSSDSRFHYDIAEHIPMVCASFGFSSERLFPITFGRNKKGGMDSVEFEKYVLGSIVPLYPHARDKKGHRVLLKVDLGPGRMNLMLLARLRRLGFVLYPGVPNTTHVSQETDQQYGAFKTQFVTNLDTIIEGRITSGVSLLLQPKMVGLPLFGGVDSETGVEIKRSAFAAGFSKEKCLRAWAKVGAATPDGVTCACLKDRQVLCAVGDDAETGESFRNIQAANDHAVHALSLAGFDAQFLQATYVAKKDVEERATITVPNTRERQLALANTKGHGGVYHVMRGGRNITNNDFFVAAELKDRKKGRADGMKKKKDAQRMEALEAKALNILENMEGKQIEDLIVDDLNGLLGWH